MLLQQNLQRAARRTLARQTNSAVLDAPDDPVHWIETEFFIPETGGALRLEPYQAAVLHKALTRDADGHFPYSVVLWSDLKKSAKSTIAGGVVLWLAWHHAWETCRVVANDLKQAASRTFYYITRAIELNPRLRAVCKVKNYHIELPNHTTIEAIASDPKGEAGGGDLIVCFTELWAAKNEAAKQLWTETTLSPLKYGQSLRWCESYAGFEGESPILEQLYQSGVTDGARVDVGIDGLELYENAAARSLCLWNTVPRCPWLTPEYYAQETAVLTPSEMARIHGNRWQQSSNPFVPIAWWNACQRDGTTFERTRSMVVALDAAVSNDCFGIVAGVRVGDVIQVIRARKWTPPPGGKLDYTSRENADDTNYPEGFLRALVRQFNVVSIVYDEYQLHDFCTRLQADGLGWFVPFPQGAQRLVADRQLYDLIRDQQIVHDGDADLHEHIYNANRTDEEQDKMRIVKRTPERKIDLAVCCSMMAYQLKYLNLG